MTILHIHFNLSAESLIRGYAFVLIEMQIHANRSEFIDAASKQELLSETLAHRWSLITVNINSPTDLQTKQLNVLPNRSSNKTIHKQYEYISPFHM